VLSGLLENILTAPSKNSSFQRRVVRILRSIYTLTEEDFPNNLRGDWRKLKAAEEHRVDQRNAWLTRTEDETAARAMSLTRKEAQEVLRAYVDIVIEITKKIGGIRKATPEIGWRILSKKLTERNFLNALPRPIPAEQPVCWSGGIWL